MNKIVDKVKHFFSDRKNVITVAVVLGVIVLVVIIALIFGRNRNNKFALNEIYDVYPEEVRNLYANIVSVSCYGDLYFDVMLDADATKVSELSKNNLMDYMLMVHTIAEIVNQYLYKYIIEILFFQFQ